MTDCSKCGDCCTNIWSVHPDRFRAILDVVPPLTPNEVLAGNQATAIFVLEHWTVLEESGRDDAKYKCDMFDEKSRLCMAHESRPPVCSGFPWYGRKPSLSTSISPRCSFNADVRKSLPIVQIT